MKGLHWAVLCCGSCRPGGPLDDPLVEFPLGHGVRHALTVYWGPSARSREVPRERGAKWRFPKDSVCRFFVHAQWLPEREGIVLSPVIPLHRNPEWFGSLPGVAGWVRSRADLNPGPPLLFTCPWTLFWAGLLPWSDLPATTSCLVSDGFEIEKFEITKVKHAVVLS